jgi:hypothetical protein
MLKSNFVMGGADGGAGTTIVNPLTGAATGKFVIHLCVVGAPITIPQPRSPELVRYRFFLHTCWEEGVKRHRLYMGHFQTRGEAEKWLETLRRIYPSAFVSETPKAEVLSAPQIVSLLDQSSPPVPQRLTAAPVPAAPRAPPRASQPQPAPRVSTGQTGMYRALQVPEKSPVKPSTSSTQKRRSISLEDTLEDLKAATPTFDEEDSLSATGVRHLRIEIQEDGARAKGKRPGSRK